MKLSTLTQQWEKAKRQNKDEARTHAYTLRLPLEDAARVAALAEIYPHQKAEDILNDMIAAALNDVMQTRQIRNRLSGQ